MFNNYNLNKIIKIIIEIKKYNFKVIYDVIWRSDGITLTLNSTSTRPFYRAMLW